ncbi:outer membrane lipoprotein-sorting protein [Larkinella terrae]|uniref:Outer membrane lipoprotein-sorting protein n=1 Tax=Larkinella terrae TaxID=2025311 RepID=A0A7K0EER6_9BACT|nr:outer membrane lipoprotein-sorting protein [Larkinella terrae]MRS60330.1 outer membrane lipoprotein-sorting protein [Larkinella terrae]
MLRKSLIIVTLWFSVSGMVAAQTSDEVVGKYIQAMGGADKLANLKTLKMSAAFQMAGIEASQNTTVINNKAFKQEVVFQGMSVVQSVLDGQGWAINPLMGQKDPTELPKEAIDMVADQMDLTGSLFQSKEKGNTVELAGKETIGSAETYKLTVTKKNGRTEIYNLDTKTYLPVKITSAQKVSGQEFKQEITTSDYQKIDGLAFPFTLSIKSAAIPGGGAMLVKVTKIEVNPAVDEAIFKMPAKK